MLLWWQRGYGLVAVAIVALYVPSFLDGAHKHAAGREWDAFRMCSMWNFTAHYLGYVASGRRDSYRDTCAHALRLLDV